MSSYCASSARPIARLLGLSHCALHSMISFIFSLACTSREFLWLLPDLYLFQILVAFSSIPEHVLTNPFADSLACPIVHCIRWSVSLSRLPVQAENFCDYCQIYIGFRFQLRFPASLSKFSLILLQTSILNYIKLTSDDCITLYTAVHSMQSLWHINKWSSKLSKSMMIKSLQNSFDYHEISSWVGGFDRCGSTDSGRPFLQ